MNLEHLVRFPSRYMCLMLLDHLGYFEHVMMKEELKKLFWCSYSPLVNLL